MSITLTKNVKIAFFTPRQFLDKRVVFRWTEEDSDGNQQGCIYIFCSTLPQELEKKFLEQTEASLNEPTSLMAKNKSAEYVTGETILSLQKITFDYKTGKNVRISVFNQVDGKLTMGISMAAKMMPKLTQDWYKKLEQFLTKTYLENEEK